MVSPREGEGLGLMVLPMEWRSDTRATYGLPIHLRGAGRCERNRLAAEAVLPDLGGEPLGDAPGLAFGRGVEDRNFTHDCSSPLAVQPACPADPADSRLLWASQSVLFNAIANLIAIHA